MWSDQVMDADLTAWLLSSIGFAVAASATPGPNNAMVAASGATFGFARSVPHILGIVVGYPVMLILLALGAGDLFRAVPVLHVVLKWVGAAYLIWLAVRIALARPMTEPGRARAAPLSFVQAALFQWVNPKAWMMAVGSIATFTQPASVTRDSLALGAIFIVAALPAVSFWTLTGVGAARLLQTPGRLRAFNYAMAALLLVSVVSMVAE